MRIITSDIREGEAEIMTHSAFPYEGLGFRDVPDSKFCYTAGGWKRIA